jgi:hypothetical protein
MGESAKYGKGKSGYIEYNLPVCSTGGISTRLILICKKENNRYI